MVEKRGKAQQSEGNESRDGERRGDGCDDRGGGDGGGGNDESPVDNPVDQQLIVELEETEEDIVNTLQVSCTRT